MTLKGLQYYLTCCDHVIQWHRPYCIYTLSLNQVVHVSFPTTPSFHNNGSPRLGSSPPSPPQNGALPPSTDWPVSGCYTSSFSLSSPDEECAGTDHSLPLPAAYVDMLIHGPQA